MSEITIAPSGEDFSELHDRMQWYVDEGILPCASTVVMRGTAVIDLALFGVMDLESRRPLTEDAIYRVYSNTKIVTSIAAMQLHEQGLFGLDDPLEAHLPGFGEMRVLRPDATSVAETEPAEGPIRIRHLLSHSAGLSYGFIEPMSVIDQAYGAAGINVFGGTTLTLETLCDRLAELPLAYQPGTSWRYSLATDVTARLVEVVSGQRFDEYLGANIFQPLGMVDTDFWVPPAKQDRFVTMYSAAEPFAPLAPAQVTADDPRDGAYSTPPRLLSGGGGLVSTISDYLTFIRMILNGGTWDDQVIVKPETLDLMRTNQLADGVRVSFPMWDMPGTVFGLGFALKESVAEGESPAMRGEYHWGGMAGTHSWMSPAAGIAGMCLTQRMPAFWHPFSHDFKQAVYRVAGGGR